VREIVLLKNTTEWFLPGIEPRPLDPEASALTITHPFVVMARKGFSESSLVKMLHRSIQIHKAYRGKRVC